MRMQWPLARQLAAHSLSQQPQALGCRQSQNAWRQRRRDHWAAVRSQEQLPGSWPPSPLKRPRMPAAASSLLRKLPRS
jgi:hypothetical protein